MASIDGTGLGAGDDAPEEGGADGPVPEPAGPAPPPATVHAAAETRADAINRIAGTVCRFIEVPTRC